MSNVKAIPSGMHTVTPHLVCAGAAEAIEFYKKAFNATETSRLPGPNGRLMHASIRIGDSTVMLVDEMPEHGALGPKSLKGSPVTIHLFVDNVDSVAARAVRAGAKTTMPVTDMFWGADNVDTIATRATIGVQLRHARSPFCDTRRQRLAYIRLRNSELPSNPRWRNACFKSGANSV